MHDRITVAPNGARRSRLDHPELPVTLAQITDTAKACFAAGAGHIHLHIRDKDGGHALDAGQYRETMAAIASAAPQMGIQITTESGGRFDPAAQLACLTQVCPKSASVAVREIAKVPYVATRLYQQADEQGTQVQHIIYTPTDLRQLLSWQTKGAVPAGRLDVIFVLGQYRPAVLAKSDDLDPFLRLAEKDDIDWSVCAFGRAEAECVLRGLAMGGRARIGFENNFRQSDGIPFPSNAHSVAHVVSLAEQYGYLTKQNESAMS